MLIVMNNIKSKLLQIEIQESILTRIDSYCQEIGDLLNSNSYLSWDMTINPNYNPEIGECRIAIYKCKRIEIVIYINYLGRLVFEPLINPIQDNFGVGVRLVNPYISSSESVTKSVINAVKRRLSEWENARDLYLQYIQSSHVKIQQQEALSRQIVLRHKREFCDKLDLPIPIEDRINLELVGEIIFTNKGIKLSDRLIPLSPIVAAIIVNLVRQESQL
jgi:hypothetical protein